MKPPSDSGYIYHIADATEWTEAVARGSYDGSALCRKDGFIHLSSAAQAFETWRVHFAPRQQGLILLRMTRASLSDALRDEAARGQTFPHLYRALLPSECDVLALTDLPGFLPPNA